MPVKMVREFDVVVDGQPVELAVLSLGRHALESSRRAMTKAYRKAVQAGRLADDTQAEALARETGVWNDERQAEFDGLARTVRAGEERLGRPDLPDDEGVQLARAVERDRAAALLLRADLARLEGDTATAAARRAQFEAAAVQCVVHRATRRRYFSSVADLNDQPEAVLRAVTDAVACAYYGCTDIAERSYLLDRGLPAEDPSC